MNKPIICGTDGSAGAHIALGAASLSAVSPGVWSPAWPAEFGRAVKGVPYAST